MKKYERPKNTSSSLIGPVILAVLFIVGSVADSELSMALIVILLSFVAIAAVFIFAFKKLKNANMGNFTSGYRGHVEKKESRLEDKPLSSTLSRAPAVYNERSAEELFLRDSQKRLEQLDVFLKNGIVDKAEYNLLKKRYENYSYERN